MRQQHSIEVADRSRLFERGQKVRFKWHRSRWNSERDGIIIEEVIVASEAYKHSRVWVVRDTRSSMAFAVPSEDIADIGDSNDN